MLRLAGKHIIQWTHQFATELKLSRSEEQIVIQGIMNGPDSFTLLNNKILSRDRLGNEGFSLCFECACLTAGETTALMGSLESLAVDAPTDDDWAQFIWLERKYLKGFCHWQRGEMTKGWNEWNFIYLQAQVTPQVERLVVAIRINETIEILNKGYFSRAAERFEKILKEKRGMIDLITLHNLLGPLSICYSCTGRFVDAANTHADIDKLLGHFNSHHLRFLSIRRKAMYYIQKDAFDLAENVISEALNIKNISNSRRALILELQFEISILKHDLEKADSMLKSIQHSLAVEPLSAGSLNVLEEETELLIRQSKPDEALLKAQQILAEAHDRGDILAEIKGKAFKARCFYLKNNYHSALQILEDIIPSAKEQGYVFSYGEVLFHAAGIAWHHNDIESLKVYLSQSLMHSRKNGLKVRSKCFAYLNALVSSDKTTSALLEVITISENGSEVDYLLDVYGFSNRNEYTLETSETKRILNERNIRSFVRKNFGLYWFSREKIMVVNSSTKGVNRVEFNKNDSFQKILELFVKSKDGLTNEDIHNVDSKTSYHSLKHGGKVRATIHRFRKALEPFGLDIVHNRIDSKLYLTDTLSLYFVSPAKN